MVSPGLLERYAGPFTGLAIDSSNGALYAIVVWIRLIGTPWSPSKTLPPVSRSRHRQ